MDHVTKAVWASAKINRKFICVETCSGYRAIATDPKGKQHLLSPDISGEDLGNAVLDALAHSRFIVPAEQPEEDQDLFDFDRNYSEWVRHLMERYSYKTNHALFKDMKLCNIESREGTMTIRPTHHRSLEAWGGGGITEKDYVVLSASSLPADVGAALRLAFSRCT